MSIMGCKNNLDLFRNLLGDLIPNNIDLYVEPFGGEFGLYEVLKEKPRTSIYNDINIDLYTQVKEKYKNDLSVSCLNKDYANIIYYFDDNNTFFFVDPPYYKKERIYPNHNFLTKENHIELYNILKYLKGDFLLCYQDKPFIIELYNEFNIHKYTGKNPILKNEIAITNY